jgi:hypothetical protein
LGLKEEAPKLKSGLLVAAAEPKGLSVGFWVLAGAFVA